MTKTKHRISIRAPRREVFGIIRDVARWPELFEPCKRVTLLSEGPDGQRFMITADANGKSMTWVSERRLDPAGGRISFSQAEPQPPLLSMEGEWRIEAEGPCQTTLTLDHQFVVRCGPNYETDLCWMRGAVDANSERELRAVKAAAEASRTRGFADELFVPAPAELVYDLLYRAENWPTFLPHCPALRVLYDDGVNQELLMTVDTSSGREEIRTVRTGDRSQEIRYFQTQAPAPLRTHEGAWTLEPRPGGVLVVSQHTIRVSCLDEEATGIEHAIRNNSRGTLAALRAHCQRPE